ncbi:uncharacterized protein SCHCODRAFT_02493967 [Schizophyllum commune H4-8]|uniref:uncharacterized protein n=1 Tax=Schizophyllum commune (strain H4-8 / FGSC 9210) TaxID=578458 RepID=UPI00215E1752|nr:uncharacterized protein SCHCODRAFT_02493967 [Schizophyllum commune H4-8]KAI5896114.1 hypothetical protein SCHCODRAFT_02493967 [Schizophyllum commune H4-8]
MKCAIVLASLLALASAAAVEKRADYPACGTTGPATLHVPDSVTVGQKFPARYCSGQYAKTSSKSITLAVDARGTADVDGAIIIADGLTPGAAGNSTPDAAGSDKTAAAGSDETAAAGGNTYDFEAELPQGQTQFPGAVSLVVVEKINDYYVVSRGVALVRGEVGWLTVRQESSYVVFTQEVKVVSA